MLLFILVSAESITPCSCIETNLEYAIIKSDAIFLGQVIKGELSLDNRIKDTNHCKSKITFKVTEFLKGTPKDSIAVYTSTEGSTCGYPFLMGRYYLVYAYGKDTLYTSLCTRTKQCELWEQGEINSIKELICYPIDSNQINTRALQRGWIECPRPTHNDLNSVFFVDENSGWIAGDSVKLRTFDGGCKWNVVSTKSKNYKILHNDFSEWSISNGGKLVPDGSAIDCQGNNTFKSVVHMGARLALRDLFLLNNEISFAVGEDGRILRIRGALNDTYFAFSGVSNDLFSVCFADAMTGFVVGDSGTILKTENGGLTWLSQITETTQSLNSIFFTSAVDGWIVGDNGIMLYTHDKGKTWQRFYHDNKDCLKSVCFVNSTTGWAVGANGTILYTCNGGQNWAKQNSGVQEQLNCVHFTNPKDGWIVGCNGVVLKTTTSGLTKQDQL